MAGAGEQYDFAYGPGSPYAHAVDLVDRWRAPGGKVVVDLGCGFGAIAEPVRALGLTYLGVDLQEPGLRSLDARGFEALSADVAKPGELREALTAALERRPVAAITALDCLEHLPNATEVLSALASYAATIGQVPLVVSIPNVSHRDLATKLLLGRWDVTPTGLLDATHVRFFAPATLATTMGATGWVQLAAHDFELEHSDQHFPADCPALLPTTPVGALLRRIRGSAAPGDVTNQFVRAYRPRGDHPDSTTGETRGTDAVSHEAERDGPFLSVLVSFGDDDPGALDALFGSLCVQTSTDFEVVVVGDPGGPDGPTRPPRELASSLLQRHGALAGRLRVADPAHEADRPGRDMHPLDRAAASARGRYLAVLGADDVAKPRWVAELAQAAAPNPGRVLDAGAAHGGHLLTVVAGHPGPLSGFAFPRSLFVDLGIDVGDGSAWSEWRLVIRAVELCGLSPTASRNLVSRRAQVRGALAGAARADILAELDQGPLLFDRNSASLLVGVLDERNQLQSQLAALRESTSWRVTAPLRMLTGWLRRR